MGRLIPFLALGCFNSRFKDRGDGGKTRVEGRAPAVSLLYASGRLPFRRQGLDLYWEARQRNRECWSAPVWNWSLAGEVLLDPDRSAKQRGNNSMIKSRCNYLGTYRTSVVVSVVAACALFSAVCSSPTDIGADVEVPALGRIETGPSRTCYLSISAEVWCWGPGGSSVEPRLEAGPGFLAISVGSGMFCGLREGGRAYCWGQNRHGEVGDGTQQTRESPTAVATAVRFAQISAGIHQTCALTGAGRAFCWGNNTYGALGVGRMGEGEVEVELRPVPVATTSRFRTVDGSTRRCALDTRGRAYCWGSVSGSFGFTYRAPGDCHSIYSHLYVGRQCVVPTPVAGGLAFVSISSGGQTDCAVTEAGKGYCWGTGEYGTLGNGAYGSGTHAVEPVAVAGDLTFESITTGAGHVCGLTVDGVPYCWGNNWMGQLGNGSDGLGGGWGIPLAPVPVPVEGGHRFIQLAAGGSHTCGLTPSHEVWCWGGNSVGELGRDPSLVNSNVPVRVELPGN
jgi:hypothetical protein